MPGSRTEICRFTINDSDVGMPIQNPDRILKITRPDFIVGIQG